MCIKVEDTFLQILRGLFRLCLITKKTTAWIKTVVLVKKNGFETVVPFQIDHNQKNKIWFKHSSDSGIKVTYCFTNKKYQNNTTIQSQLDNGDLKLKFGDQSLIHYRYEMKLPPEGVDKLYQKSGYITPLFLPKEILLPEFNHPTIITITVFGDPGLEPESMIE